MDAARARLMRDLLAGTEWAYRTRAFARALRGAGHSPGGLLLVGTPDDEPWHLTAHLGDEARYAEVPELSPVLVRHRVPEGAPPHLSVDLRRLEAARRGETLFVVAPGPAPEGLLSRVDDARHAGATVLAMESGDRELRAIAHEALTVTGEPPEHDGGLWQPAVLAADGVIVPRDLGAAFETAQHLVSVAAEETVTRAGGRRGFRDRLARFLEEVSGPATASP